MKVSEFFGIGEGTVHLYVYRVVTAILSLEKRLIQWPKPGTADYKATTDMHLYYHGFPNCVGFVDGSHFALWRKPIVQGNTYFTRHDEYALNGTFVVDAETRILYAAIGCIPIHVCADFRHRINS